MSVYNVVSGGTYKRETPIAIKDSVNKDAYLSYDINDESKERYILSGSEVIYRNGLRQDENVDYVIVSPNIIRFFIAIHSRESLLADYLLNDIQ